MTAGCQLPPQPGGSVFDLTMEGRSILHERLSVPPDLFGRAPAEYTPTPARVTEVCICSPNRIGARDVGAGCMASHCRCSRFCRSSGP